MTLPNPIEPRPAYDTQEGYGDSDDVVGGTTGMSAEFNSVTFNGNGKGSGGNNEKETGTSGADRSTSGNMTTSSLGVRRGDTMKKKGPSLAKIADALSMMVEEARVDRKRDEACADRMAEEARANRMAEEARTAEARADKMAVEARAYEISIAGVMHHLKQVDEDVCDNDFYARCTHLLMNHPPAREVYAAVKDMTEQLLVFLRHECYEDKM